MKTQPWHELLLEALAEAADRDAQHRAWVEESGPNLPPPKELVCQIFEDSGLGDLLEEGVFSEEVDGIFRQMDSLAKEVDLDQAPDLLLKDSAWGRFCHLARLADLGVRRALRTHEGLED